MATATSRRAQPDEKLLVERRALSTERVAIERELLPLEAKSAAIDARLKVIATDIGESFKETFEDGSYVSASGAVAAEFKGKAPVIQIEKYNALDAAERRSLEKRGIVKIEDQWGKASNGRVTVKVFGGGA